MKAKIKACECGHTKFTEFAMCATRQSGIVITEDNDRNATCNYETSDLINFEDETPYVTGYKCDACDKEYPIEFGGYMVNRVRIQIGVEGGLVTGVSSDGPVDVLILDFDIEGGTDDEISKINGSDCFVRNFDADIDPEYIDDCFRQVQVGGAA